MLDCDLEERVNHASKTASAVLFTMTKGWLHAQLPHPPSRSSLSNAGSKILKYWRGHA